jgi:hypothetical protein
MAPIIDSMSARRTWLPVLGLGILASQAGHLAAYQLRFGAAAQHLQSSGVHGYFPLAVKSTLGLVAVLAIGGVFMVGAARALGGGRPRAGTAPAYLRLLAILFTVQLACFFGQEVIEAMVAGLPTDSAAHLLLWGALGQLPVAAVAAAGLRWLLVRFDSAIREIRVALASRPAPAAPAAPARAWAPVWPSPSPESMLDVVAGASMVKRGPPSRLRFSPD